MELAGHRFNPDKADKLLDRKRRELVPPEQVIKELNVNQENVIADLGAGNGFFTLPFIGKSNKSTSICC